MAHEPLKTEIREKQKFPLKSQVQEFIAVITAFSTLLKKETEALKKADFKTVDTLQTDKKLFAKQYHAKAVVLIERKDELAGLELALREKLVKEREKFSVVLSDNMYALDLAQNSTKRLVERILEVAREAVMERQETNYSSKGKTASCKSDTMSLTVNQSL